MYNCMRKHANNVSLHYFLYWQQVSYHVFGYPFTIALFTVICSQQFDLHVREYTSERYK